MIIVTGGAGFIGANLIAGLNQRGREDILVVDNLTNADKIHNLARLKIHDYMDKDEFYQHLVDKTDFGTVEAVFHQGACSDTMATDGRYVLHNNLTYSKKVLDFCARYRAQFIYASSASVYGAGRVFAEAADNEAALNAYAWSKLIFDRQIRALGAQDFQICGLRYFNVYGPGEQHKGRMASVVWQFYHQYQRNQRVNLFAGCGGFGDGEQRRDFIYVADAVAVNLFLWDNPEISGIFNTGTGQAESFNTLALGVINHIRARAGKGALTLDEAVQHGEIGYIPMPDALRGKYQSYTQADLGHIRKVGYRGAFQDLISGINRCLEQAATESVAIPDSGDC